MSQLIALGVVEAYIGLTAAILVVIGRRAESRRFRARFAPYTLRDDK